MNIRSIKGFTLLELLITLTVLFTILGIGVPAFSEVIENNKRKDTVYQLMGMLNFARNSAVNLGENVVICPSRNGISCENSTQWSTKMIVFIDSNKNNEWDESEDLLRSFDYQSETQSLNWKSFGSKAWLSYHADGTTGYQSGRIYYCYQGGQEVDNKAQVIVYRTGRARIAAPEEFKSGC